MIWNPDVDARTSNGRRARLRKSRVVRGTFRLNGIHVSCLNVPMAAIVRRGHVHAAALPLHVSTTATFCRRQLSTRKGA